LEATAHDALPANHRSLTASDESRILVLEAENSRLRQLVAELLVRNQQVRELSFGSSNAKGLV
jgi:hypothetical protein